MGKTKKQEKPVDEYETVFELPGCEFGSLLSPAGRSALKIADAMMQRDNDRRRKLENRP